MDSSIICNSGPPSLTQSRCSRSLSHHLLLSTRHRLPFLLPVNNRSFPEAFRFLGLRKPSCLMASAALMANSAPSRGRVYTVGDFMTRKEDLHAVKSTTSVEEGFIRASARVLCCEIIVDLDSFSWEILKNVLKVGLVSDYDLLALDSISGERRMSNSLFPEADSTWKTFNEVQKLLIKANGKVVGDLMTPAPVVVRETTNLEDAARLLLQSKYHRLPVVDAEGKLVGIITRGDVVRAALRMKREIEARG